MTMSSTTSIAYLLMIAVTVGVATAQSPAPALDCFTYLLKLSDCLTFVEEGSNLSQPAPGCCPELANLVDTQPICLCQLLGDPSHSQIGISVDLNRALQLPSLCNVITPPVSLCAGTCNSSPSFFKFIMHILFFFLYNYFFSSKKAPFHKRDLNNYTPSSIVPVHQFDPSMIKVSLILL